MTFPWVRVVSAAATIFVTSGLPSQASAAARVTAPAPPASCPARWTANGLPLPQAPASVNGRIQSVAALSASDVWMLALGSVSGGMTSAYVYHLVGGTWEGPASPGGGQPFNAQSIQARSDSDVWVTGTSDSDTPQVWHYDGSAWTDASAGLPAEAEIAASALGGDGSLYVAGFSYTTATAMIWRYDDSRWTDVTPADHPHQYNAVAVAADGTLIAGGGGTGDGMLQERAGTTWTTVSLSRPVQIVNGIGAAPGGTVYAVGQASANQPVLIDQRPGGQSATVLDAPAARPASAVTVEMGVVASGAGDVWLMGQYELDGTYDPWITHFDGRTFTDAATPKFSSSDYAIAGGAPLGSAVLGYGAADSDGNAAPKFIAACPVQVTSTSITPAQRRTPIGSQVFWSVPAAQTARHELVVPGLFNSGRINPGGSFAYSFFAAATYTVHDTPTGAAGAVKVPVTATPASGSQGTVFTITSASIQAPAGYSYRLLIRRPGAARYTLLTTTSHPTTNFIPDRGRGTYAFESEVRTPAGATAPSPAATITVS